MKYLIYILFIISLFSCQNDDGYTPVIPNINERTLAGGETTIFSSNFFSFDNPAPNLNTANLELHLAGDGQFEQAFVTAPATINSGSGPQFNHTSCVACHPTDGRSPFPENDINSFSGFFLRTSIPGTDDCGGPNPTPGFGVQLQNHANVGVEPEVQFGVTYQNIPVNFADGTVVTLRKPTYFIESSYIPFPSNAMLSPRIGPPVFGLGLLEAITEENILLKQDINDVDGDGISGKANYVCDPVTNSLALGRFGWKANTPSVMAQNAGASHNDMGVTNPLFPVESSFGQTNGDNINDDPEVNQQTLDILNVYLLTLAVPAARNLDDVEVAKGFELFEEAKCTACHTPKYVTGNYPDIPTISNQTIYPYTDMLLHDMGEGLADNRPDFLANGNEWKTRPLWGIGLTENVNGHTDFLHDGRAQNLEETILWHGGEAENSKQFYTNLNKSDRNALLAFVNAL